MEILDLASDYGLEHIGLTNLGSVSWNLSTSALYENAIRTSEAQIAHLGPLIVRMGQHTGRAAKDKYIVDEPSSRDDIWWGPVNVKYPRERFTHLHDRMCSYLRGKNVFVQYRYVGAD